MPNKRRPARSLEIAVPKRRKPDMSRECHPQSTTGTEAGERRARGNQHALASARLREDHDRDFGAEGRALAKRVGADDPPSDLRIAWGPASQRVAREHGAVAFSFGSKVFADLDRWRPGTEEGDLVLGHELQHAAERRSDGPRLALLTEAEFRRQLGTQPEQRVTIDALFANASFRALWDYLGACSAPPGQDHGPLRLLVTPGLRSGGVERFGGYTPGVRQLEINPTKAEHVQNPQELVDTIVHEVIHAIFDLESACVAAGSPAAPLGGAGNAPRTTGSLPSLGATLPGPSASNPCDESIDINVKAQTIITDVIRDTSSGTRLGFPTLTFLNELIRSDPAALSAYDTCRRPACAIANPALKRDAIARCSLDVLGTFMSGSLLPSRVLFDFNSTAIRPDSATALELVAIFLRAHSTTHVDVVGHADPVGSDVFNEGLALRRAQAVQAFLLARAVPAAQIGSPTSMGERARISTGPSEHFQDRRVELVFSSVP
jgi:outer membrane protein OmpA-like peptidoglycan-associated protein